VEDLKCDRRTSISGNHTSWSIWENHRRYADWVSPYARRLHLLGPTEAVVFKLSSALSRASLPTWSTKDLHAGDYGRIAGSCVPRTVRELLDHVERRRVAVPNTVPAAPALAVGSPVVQDCAAENHGCECVGRSTRASPIPDWFSVTRFAAWRVYSRRGLGAWVPVARCSAVASFVARRCSPARWRVVPTLERLPLWNLSSVCHQRFRLAWLWDASDQAVQQPERDNPSRCAICC